MNPITEQSEKNNLTLSEKLLSSFGLLSLRTTPNESVIPALSPLDKDSVNSELESVAPVEDLTSRSSSTERSEDRMMSGSNTDGSESLNSYNLARKEISHRRVRKEQEFSLKKISVTEDDRKVSREEKMRMHRKRFSQSVQNIHHFQSRNSRKMSDNIYHPNYICHDMQVFLADKKLNVKCDRDQTLRTILESITPALPLDTHYPTDSRGNELNLDNPISLIPFGQIFFLNRDGTETPNHIVCEDGRIVSVNDIFKERSKKEFERITKEDNSFKFKLPKSRDPSPPINLSKADGVKEDIKNLIQTIKPEQLHVEQDVCQNGIPVILGGTIQALIILLTHPLSKHLDLSVPFLLALERIIQPIDFCKLLFDRWDEVKDKCDCRAVRERIMELFIQMFEIRRDIFENRKLTTTILLKKNQIKMKGYNAEICTNFSNVFHQLAVVIDLPSDTESFPVLLENYDILDFNSKDIARQLALIDSELIKNIKPSEWTCGDETHIKKYTERYNKMSRWVTTMIILAPTPTMKVIMFKKFLRILKECFRLKNYTAVMEIVNGLCNSNCEKLYKYLSPGISQHDLDRLKTVENPLGMFKYMRDLQKSVQEPCIPFLTCYIQMIKTMEEISNNNEVPEGQFNLYKILKITPYIQIIESFRSKCQYNIPVDQKLRHYLENLIVLSDTEIDRYTRSHIENLKLFNLSSKNAATSRS